MKLSPYTELQQTHLRKSIHLLSIVTLLVVMINIGVGGFVTYRSWNGLRQAENQLAEQSAALQSAQAKPVVKQAENGEITSLLNALPIDLGLSELTRFIRTTAEDNEVLFVRLSEEQGNDSAATAPTRTPIEATPAPAPDLNIEGNIPSPATNAPVQTTGGVLPYSFSTTLYGEIDDLVAFVTALYGANRFLTVDTVNLVKTPDAGTEDIGKLLERMPRVPDSRKLYSLDLTFHAFTLPESFREQLNTDKKSVTFAP
jgi:hypothetical protein